MNGDVLTTIDYEELVRFHREQGNAVTIATRERSIKIDYGLLHLDADSRVREYEEKPTIASPREHGHLRHGAEVIELVPEGEYFDFRISSGSLLEAGEPVGAYDHTGLWFDIGRQEDYERAINVWLEDEEQANGNGNGNGRATGTSNGNGLASDPRNGNGNAEREREREQSELRTEHGTACCAW